MRWLKITTGGEVLRIDMPADYEDGLKPEYNAIGRGCYIVEMLDSPNNNAELWFDEEAKITDPPSPPNVLACFVAGRLGIRLSQLDSIHGDVLVGRTLNKGNENAEQRGDVSEEIEQLLQDWRTELLTGEFAIKTWDQACRIAGAAGRRQPSPCE